MHDCNATKVQLLNELTRISGFLDTYAPAHSENAGHPACTSMYEEMQADIDRHIGNLKQAVVGLAQEGKF